MAIDSDDLAPRKPEPLALGADLSRLSVSDLEERIAALQAEIERCRALVSSKVMSRDAANAVFKS